MCLSKTVWASFGDSSTSCKETISIASHIVFTAGSWPMVYHTATLIALSLGLLFPSLGAKITTPIIIYTSCYSGSRQCMRGRNTLIFILLLSFFPHYILRNWRRSGPAAPNGSLPGVSLEPSFHWSSVSPTNRYTSADPYPCRICQWVAHRKRILWTSYSKACRWKRQPVFPQAIIHTNTSSDSIKGLDDNLALD